MSQKNSDLDSEKWCLSYNYFSVCSFICSGVAFGFNGHKLVCKVKWKEWEI